MKWLGVCIFALVSVLGGACIFGENSRAATAELWLEGRPAKVFDAVDRNAPTSSNCAGVTEPVEIRGETGIKDACVFGRPNLLRVASYSRVADGRVTYAVAYPDERFFTPVVGLCEGLDRCIYGQAGDMVLIASEIVTDIAIYRSYTMVKDFSQHITKNADNPQTYQFEYDGEGVELRAGQRVIKVGAIAVSPNGRWVLLELVGYGLARVDTVSGEYTRVVSYDSLPGAADTDVSLGISSDGRWGVVTGYADGIYIYGFNNTCGDQLTATLSALYSMETVLCPYRVVRADSQLFELENLYAPKFSIHGQRLTLYRYGNEPRKIVLVPQGAGGGDPYYLAFGDSFTSGEGELSDEYYQVGTNTAQNHCHVSTRSYPYLLQSSWEISANNLACSGSRMEEVRKTSDAYSFTVRARSPTAVSLSIGGNDVDFMGKLKTCLGPGTCEWAREGNRKSTAYELRALFPKLVNLINELRGEYERAKLLIVGYPKIINDQAQCSVVTGLLLNTEERRYMNESIHYLNRVLKAAADYTKSTFADIEDAYTGERLCDNRETAMNVIRYGDDIAPIPFLNTVKLIGAESFHPTPRGHQLAKSAIATTLASFWDSPTCNDCIYEENDLSMPAYWFAGDSMDEPQRRPIAKQFLNAGVFSQAAGALATFMSGMFAPGSLVKFELHSDAKNLGQFAAKNDGSLTESVALPTDSAGYHTLHAYGTSFSGEAIDIYQTIYIEGDASGAVDDFTGSITHSSGGSSDEEVKSLKTKESSMVVAFQGAPENNSVGQIKGVQVGNIQPTLSFSTPAYQKVSKSFDWWVIVIIVGSGVLCLWFFIANKAKQ